MKISTVFECVTDFPDDRIEDGDEIVEPGGRTAACAVSDLLRDAGMITSIPELDREHDNWVFDAVQDGQKYYLQVNLDGEILWIMTENFSPLWPWFGRKARYVSFLNDLHRLLSQDERFKSVNWEVP
jgi:hypothetical protein